MSGRITTSRTPVAVFTYNRPEHTRRGLNALARCTRLDECRVHVYCDGAKTPAQATDVAASRRVVREWAAAHDAVVVERRHNLGLARSIVTGVTDLCGQHGRVIVVEDDLVVSADVVDYMLQALDRYADAPQVYQISGYMFPVQHPAAPDALFLPLGSTWGWATWQRAWRRFDGAAAGSEQLLADPAVRRRFDLDDSYPYAAMLQQRLAGQNDSWGILWQYGIFNEDALVLYPRESLVWNGGFDGSGTHCSGSGEILQGTRDDVQAMRLSRPFTWPDRVALDADAFERIKVFLRTAQAARKQSVLTRARGRLRRYLQAGIR